ncbi:MAG: adenylate/guanylate cyclase domain-containing protein [Candidatus Promineifilaceae bacterium]|nr:adenylate/guanylate cyclase domain-containing protein [Candidatus Promineifilaceae bacterium]
MSVSQNPDLVNTLVSFAPGLIRRRLQNEPRPPRQPLANRCSAAVLFADISGFTALAEHLTTQQRADAEDLANLLNEYFRRVIAVVQMHGGEVTKLAGDGLLVLWPIAAGMARLGHDAQVALAECVARAAQCAIDLQSELHEFRSAAGLTLSLGIGIGAGDVYDVHLGGVFGRWEFLLSGSPLVQMSLAKEQARPGRIVLSPEAWTLVKDSAKGQPLADGFAELESLRQVPARKGLDLPMLGDEAIDGLKAYIPAAILTRVEAGQQHWLSEMRRITVLFIKLPGYGTSITHPYARTLPEAQAVMEALQTALYNYEGSINKFNVDDKGITLVAALGLAPLSHRDDAARGVHAALEMRAALEALGRASAIGIATGWVFCGPIGHETQREYTVVGNDVNMAARLMQVAEREFGAGSRASGIVCDSNTYKAVQREAQRHSPLATALTFDEMAPARVKGRPDPVSVYRPALLSSTARWTRRSLRQPPVDLTDRQQELAQLVAALESDLSERGREGSRVVILEGEAGVGKTRLLDRLLEEAERRQVSTLLGTGVKVESSVPFHAWSPVFHQLFGVERPGLAPGQIRNKVMARLPMMPGERGYPALAVKLSPLLKAVLPLDIAENEFTASLNRLERLRTTRLFLLRLLQLAMDESKGRRAARVVILENGQWFDPYSWELALAAGRQVKQMMMIIATRPLGRRGLQSTAPEACRRLLADGVTTRLQVNTLTVKGVESLACDLLGVQAVADGVVDVLHRRTGGNPLFVEEILLNWREQGLIRTEGDRCDSTANLAVLANTPSPEAVHKVTAGQIDQLEPALQMVLKTASMLGEWFTLEDLKGVYPIARDRDRLDAFLRVLTQLHLLRAKYSAGESEYAFESGAMRETANRLLTEGQRRQLL